MKRDRRDDLTAKKYLSRDFPLEQHIFARGNLPSENAKVNSNAATINTNLMPDFEQKIQHCYRNQFFVTKDMGKKNFHRSCLERINLSWFVTTLSSAKTKHLLGILICRHFDAVCFYGAHSFSRGNHASDLKHAQSFCRCVGIARKSRSAVLSERRLSRIKTVKQARKVKNLKRVRGGL